MQPKEFISVYNTTTVNDRAVKLYELSRNTEQLAALISLIEENAMDFFAPPPKTPDQKPAWEVSAHMDYFSRMLLTKLRSEIQAGESISQGDPYKEKDEDAGESGNRSRA